MDLLVDDSCIVVCPKSRKLSFFIIYKTKTQKQ